MTPETKQTTEDSQQGQRSHSACDDLLGFAVGDMVDCKRWDATVPPVNRVGVAKVVRVYRAQCESGVMVKVRGKGVLELDSNWLERILA